jgi:hypothetical protein
MEEVNVIKNTAEKKIFSVGTDDVISALYKLKSTVSLFSDNILTLEHRAA